MSRKILLPSFETPGEHGGIARYIHSITETITDVSVFKVEAGMGRREIAQAVQKAATEYEELWIHHVLPLGTIARLLGKPYVVFLHGMDFDLARRTIWKRILTRKILRDARKVVVNSEALAKEVKEFAGVDPEVVYPCVSEEMVERSRRGRVIRPTDSRAGEKTSPLRLLIVSRLVERKGHLRVLEAIKDMQDIEYVIIGEGPFRSSIEQKIKELNLEGGVSMLGSISDEDLAEEYRKADIFVMPTLKNDHDREGFGIVYLEAGLFELPVIASDVPGVSEAVVHGKTGILVKKDVHGAIKRLVEDADLRRKLGKEGCIRTLKLFVREVQMEKLKELLLY